MKMILVENTSTSIYHCEEMRLVPGLNEVRDYIFEKAKNNPGVKKRMKAGMIKVANFKSSSESKDSAEVSVDSFVLEGMKGPEAIGTVNKMHDLETLEKWHALEKRKGVLKAIEEKIEVLIGEQDDDDSDSEDDE